MQNISKLLKLLEDFFFKLWPVSRSISRYKKMYFLANTPQNVDNTHRAKCFAYSLMHSFRSV